MVASFFIFFALFCVDLVASFRGLQRIVNCRSETPVTRLSASTDDNNASSKPSTLQSDICIIGGGFGGLYTAIKVSNMIKDNENIGVTLIDPKDKFVFLPLLYELALGAASVTEVAPRYSSLLKGSKVKFIQGAVDKVDLGRDEVVLTENGVTERMKFQQLVMAVGAQPRLDLIPGAKEHSLPFYRVEDAYKLQTNLRALQANDQKRVIRIVVLGGGYSGVEVATSVAKYLEASKSVVTIVDRNKRVMSSSPDHNREVAEKILAERGVSVNTETSVKCVTESGVTVVDKDGNEFDMAADLVILTAGMEQTQLVGATRLPKDRFGRLQTSRTLQSISKDHPNVYAMGDCASIEGYSLPTTAQVAMQQADIAAKNLITRARTYKTLEDARTPSKPEELEKFKFVPLGEMLTLGPLDAAITSLGGLVELEGPLAALGRRAIYAIRMPTPGQQLAALVSSSVAQASSLALGLLEKKRSKGKGK